MQHNLENHEVAGSFVISYPKAKKNLRSIRFGIEIGRGEGHGKWKRKQGLGA